MLSTNAILEMRQNLRIHSQILDLMDEIEIRRIENADDLEDVLKFRYRCYHSKGFIDANPEKICTDKFDDLPNTTLFGLYRDNRLVSSIRVHLLDRENRYSPSTLAFPDIFEPKFEQGARLIDSSRFTVDPEAADDEKKLHFITMRLSVLACVYHDVDYSLSLIRTNHAAFYRRYFGFEQWGEARSYPGVNFQVAQYACDIKKAGDAALRRLPFMNSLASERKLLFDREASREACFCVRPSARTAVDMMLRTVRIPTTLEPAIGDQSAA